MLKRMKNQFSDLIVAETVDATNSAICIKRNKKTEQYNSAGGGVFAGAASQGRSQP